MNSNGLLKVFLDNYDLFFKGLLGTLKLAIIAVLIGTIIGALIATIYSSKNKFLKALAKIYMEVIRGTPLLVQIYIVYFFLPVAFPAIEVLGKDGSIIFALIINSSAYVSEIIRAGINSVDKGQREAAISLGLKNSNVMKKVILPQAIKNILPALGNEFITMVKETSIAAVFMVNELMYVKMILANKLLIWQPILIIALIYLGVNLILSSLVKMMERRLNSYA